MEKDCKFVGFLSNYEVYRHLKEIKETGVGRQDRHFNNMPMNTLIYETLQYFHGTPCVSQSDEAVRAFVQRLKPYNLTKPEEIAMLNMRPTTAVEIQAIVEESEERLTETQIAEIIQIIAEVLPLPSNQAVKVEPPAAPAEEPSLAHE